LPKAQILEQLSGIHAMQVCTFNELETLANKLFYPCMDDCEGQPICSTAGAPSLREYLDMIQMKHEKISQLVTNILSAF